jgi:hypothetical protein
MRILIGAVLTLVLSGIEAGAQQSKPGSKIPKFAPIAARSFAKIGSPSGSRTAFLSATRAA